VTRRQLRSRGDLFESGPTGGGRAGVVCPADFPAGESGWERGMAKNDQAPMSSGRRAGSARGGFSAKWIRVALSMSILLFKKSGNSPWGWATDVPAPPPRRVGEYKIRCLAEGVALSAGWNAGRSRYPASQQLFLASRSSWHGPSRWGFHQ